MANKKIKYTPIYNPFNIVKNFEEEICNYTGAKYAVCIDSCTNAIFLCCKYLKVENITIPRKTYLSVPQAIMNAGGKVKLEDVIWKGLYQLKPYPIFDSALRFTENMYESGKFYCLSFHYKKHLPIMPNGVHRDLGAYIEYTNREWNEFVAKYENWQDIWNKFKTLKFKYVLIDYMSTFDLNWIEPNRKTLLNLSDVFTHSPYIATQSLKYRISCENKLINNHFLNLYFHIKNLCIN